MKQWYLGFKFQFTGGPSSEKQYVHLFEIKEVIPEHKLAYSWKYKGFEGNSFKVAVQL